MWCLLRVTSDRKSPKFLRTSDVSALGGLVWNIEMGRCCMKSWTPSRHADGDWAWDSQKECLHENCPTDTCCQLHRNAAPFLLVTIKTAIVCFHFQSSLDMRMRQPSSRHSTSCRSRSVFFLLSETICDDPSETSVPKFLAPFKKNLLLIAQ